MLFYKRKENNSNLNKIRVYVVMEELFLAKILKRNFFVFPTPNRENWTIENFALSRVVIK